MHAREHMYAWRVLMHWRCGTQRVARQFFQTAVMLSLLADVAGSTLHDCMQEAMKGVVGLRQYSGWISPVSGVMLLAGGTYTILSRIA